ncbi:MAG TPA: SpoIIE family protein phosphatase [Vicinamibacteria bacterium]|nr:SpoIIE family protein phosphatase [Vicinamibacteria bacterium]
MAPRILIADDQPDVRLALELLLKSDGLESTAVDSPAAVLEAVEGGHFDLALLDLNYARDTTSGQEGLELLPRLRALDGAIPVLVMTAWGTIDLAVEAMRRGARGFVLKPWRNSELLRTVREQLAAVAESPRTGGERDLAVAKRVQAGFLPHAGPKIATLEYAGFCAQAGPVGGDGYDFLDLGSGRLGIMLADASGKGVPAALLMASLQGILRSEAAHGTDDLLSLLAEANRIFFASTAPEHYATLFFATFEEDRSAVRYVNCGHNPPLLLRADGRVERLAPTAPALGLLDRWTGAQDEVCLGPGDTLLVYTDGATEASGPEGDEFGEGRLEAALRENAGRPLEAMRRGLMAAIEAFAGRGQRDDLTLVLARARAAEHAKLSVSPVAQSPGKTERHSFWT